MNKRSVKKKRAVKAAPKTSRSTSARKAPARAAMARKSAVRQSARKSEPMKNGNIAPAEIRTVSIAQVRALNPVLRTHRFEVGQTVFYTSSPISRPGATGSYKVVRLLPSDGDDYQYRIKNPGEAFERVAKESQLEVEH
jgi:hypothetical protein